MYILKCNNCIMMYIYVEESSHVLYYVIRHVPLYRSHPGYWCEFFSFILPSTQVNGKIQRVEQSVERFRPGNAFESETFVM